MEELYEGNHTQEEVNEDMQHDQIEETPEQVEEAPDTTQEERDYFTVKYNKEEKQVSYDEAPNYIQKGMNYDKVKEQAEQQTQYLERLAKMSGYEDTDAFIKAVEQAEEQQKIQQEAQRLGLDEEAYREHIAPQNEKLSSMEQELQTLKQREAQRQVESEINSLKQKYEDFDNYEDSIYDYAMKGYSLEDAYKIASYEDKLQRIGKEKEQEVLAKVTGRNEKQVIPTNDKGSNAQFDPSNMSFDDIEALSKRVRSGERITF